MKIRNGSYVDFTPDWYPLGYMLVSYGRNKYGDDFWKKVTHDAASYKGVFFPFEKAIKRYSGKDFTDFRTDGLNYFKQQFTEPYNIPDSLLKLNKYNLFDHVTGVNITLKHKHFNADHEYPAYVNDSTLIYMKTTYNHNPAFVIKTSNSERKISTRSFSLDTYFDYHDGKIVYSAYRPDLRWTYRDYSELMLLDVNTGKERRISKGTKYFAPSFSEDGKTIVVVEEAPSGKCTLLLLNASDGKLISSIPNNGHLFYTYPKFVNGKILSAIRNNKGKMSLGLVDIKTGEVNYLLPFSYQPIVFPKISHDTVYFSATTDINDRLFALNLSTHKLYELKSDSLTQFIGNYEAAVSGNKVSWVSFTAFGYKMHEADKSTIIWEEITDNKIPGSLPEFQIAALTRDSSTNLLADIKDKPLPVTKYHKAYNLFNFHSLIPNVNDPNYTLSLAGENVLNTFQSNLSFTYNRDEGYKEVGFSAIYGALFPFVNGGVDYTFDRRAYYRGGNVYWNETNAYLGPELPLNFSEGKQSTFLNIGSNVNFSSTNFQAAYQSLFPNKAYTYLDNYLSFYNSNQQALQNIFPTLGQSIYIDYKDAISGLTASQFLAEGTFYFPGLVTNHSLAITIAHQQKGSANEVIDFSNDFPFARGYTAENLYRLNGGGVNYHFPIVYPDAGLANFIFFQRIRGNAFFDYTRANDFYDDGSKFQANFRSTGLEVYFDTKWFNQDAISFGFRYDRLLDPDLFGGYGRNRFEFIVPITIF